MTDRSKKARPKGCIVPLKDGRFQPLIRLSDGSRKRGDPYPLGTTEDEARQKSLADQARAIREGWTSAARAVRLRHSKDAGESCSAWVKAWHNSRISRLSSASHNMGHWNTHLADWLGSKHPKDWTRDDFRKLSAELDRKVEAGEIGWKTAQNAWGTAIKMADDACNSKLDTLRCRDENPALKVRGPDRGAKTVRQYLYPSELLQLVSCSLVPVAFRRAAVIAIYTYTRAGELRALTWEDADIRRGILSITKAVDRETGELKTTKTKTPRLVPIEPALTPLLKIMRKESRGQGLVLPISLEDTPAADLRKWLKAAGVKRQMLFNRSPSVSHIRWHDLRATGITWMAVRGDDPMKIQARAGHSDFNTTQGYVREADILRAGFGAPFPPLPKGFLEAKSDQSLDQTSKNSVNSVTPRGFEPLLPA